MISAHQKNYQLCRNGSNIRPRCSRKEHHDSINWLVLLFGAQKRRKRAFTLFQAQMIVSSSRRAWIKRHSHSHRRAAVVRPTTKSDFLEAEESRLTRAEHRRSPFAVRRGGESSSAGMKENTVTFLLGVKMEPDCKPPHLLPCVLNYV